MEGFKMATPTTNIGEIQLKKWAQEFENNSEVRNLNCGGCAIVALALYKGLKEKGMLIGDEKLVYCYDTNWGENFRQVRNEDYLNGESKETDSCTHCLLYHNGHYYDDGGRTNPHRWCDEFHYIDMNNTKHVNFIIESINSDNWNTWFNRETQIPLIEQIVGISLSEVKVYVDCF